MTTVLLWALPLLSLFLLWALFDPRKVIPPDAGFTGRVSVVVPARNEEKTLPALLESLPRKLGASHDCIVVNDGSSDRTAEVATSRGARVIEAPPLPRERWTGKNWACHNGSKAAEGDFLAFLDADTRFEAGGFERILAFAEKRGSVGPVSVLPYYESREAYEELSAFFIVSMALGSGSFARGPLARARLFGQSLFVRATAYREIGGHEGVSDRILENFFLSERFERAGGMPESRLGLGTLRVRMFPEGLAQLIESWTKAFSVGAGATPPSILSLIVLWMCVLFGLPILALLASLGFVELSGAHLGIAYLALVAQLYWLLRKLGEFSFLTALLYPLPLVFYQVVFFRGLKRSRLKQRVEWKGRSLPSR